MGYARTGGLDRRRDNPAFSDSAHMENFYDSFTIAGSLLSGVEGARAGYRPY